VRRSISSIRKTDVRENTQVSDGSIVVRFLQDIPEIVGVDMKSYGPFKKEDVASLPIPNAQALVKQGAVREIEVRGIT
jgi:DNA replication initiation complex subunit (GINS family)